MIGVLPGRQLSLILSLSLVLFWPHPSPAVVRHHLQVDIDPANSRFTARDRVLLPSDRPVPARLAFTLHADLDPASPDGKVVALDTLNVPSGPMQATYAISLPAGADSFTLRYGGTIAHPLGEVGEESARGQRHTVGAIGPEGVYLDGGSGWYPGLPEDPDVVFDLSVRLPPGWDAVSQGDRASRGRTDRGTTVRWTCDLPQEGIWLAAGPWTETSRVANGVEGMVFLRAPDSELAGRYLDATERYVALYSSLLGPYPYRKFAVAENFWETGYGMPSFTLLGPRVIRFPFILDSSYPHEILHNWWGNGVRIDYASGNWGEGLTAYLADHLMKERKGEDVAHRQETLQKYADYVLQGRDLPLSAFRSRHGSVTEAVGYGKSMMLYHMLRRDLGDEAFVGGLRDLYRRNLHRRAAFTQVREAFEAASGRDLGPFFRQWVDREGAPDLVLEGVRAAAPADSRRLSVTLRQAQPGEPFRLEVPVAVTVEGKEDAVTVVVPMEGRTATTQIALDARPLRVDVDPAFDLFRRLDRREIPPALTQAFGAQDAVLVLPAGAPAGLRDAYGRLAQSLARTGPGKVEVTDDGKLGAPPPGRSVWVLGSENRLASWVEGALTGYPVRVEAGRVTLGGTAVDAPSALVLTARRPDNADLALLWIVLGDPAAAEGLARKLPHYHKYSYLAFVGTEPENAAKGRWPVVGSPLTAQTGKGDAPMARLPARPLLTAAAAAIDGGRMMDAIVALSADVMKGRGLGTPELDRAADLIAQEFLLAGIKPSGDGEGYFQSWREPVGTGGPDTALRNVLAVLPGSDPALSSQFVLVGAHYDHLGTGGPGALSFNLGRVHPGADDNASGVAVMLELARSLSASPPPRPVLFAAFTGEERGRLGSSRYVAHPALPLADTVAMVNLDTLGRLGKGPLLAMGSDSSAGWAPILARAGSAAGTSIQATAPDLDSGDQEVLLSAGVPSVGLFTGAHEDYHRPTDTADRIDARGLVRAATAARAIVWELASAKEPMARIPTAAPRHGQGADGATGERKVSIGAVPDFAYQGKGVRLSGTAAGSPAERAGLLAGDVITAVDGQPVASLRDFSAVLKAREAGDNVTLTFTRDGVRHAVTVVVEAR